MQRREPIIIRPTMRNDPSVTRFQTQSQQYGLINSTNMASSTAYVMVHLSLHKSIPSNAIISHKIGRLEEKRFFVKVKNGKGNLPFNIYHEIFFLTC